MAGELTSGEAGGIAEAIRSEMAFLEGKEIPMREAQDRICNAIRNSIADRQLVELVCALVALSLTRRL